MMNPPGSNRLQPTPESDLTLSDGLIVTLRDPILPNATTLSDAAALTRVQSIVRLYLKEGWVVQSLGKHCRDYAIRRSPEVPNPSVPEAFDLAYKLRSDPDIEACEVSLFQPTEAPDFLSLTQGMGFGPTSSSNNSGPDAGGLPCSANRTWALEVCEIPNAWDLALPDGGQARGAGIRVGHPDTGYTNHPQLDPNRLLKSSGYNFEENVQDPRDPISGQFGGHGTSTGSVIMSGVGNVTGAAPECQLIPLRVTNSVILLSYSRLIPAIRYAADHQHHVISISLGGPFSSSALERAVQYAIDKGVIVCCAAGNQWPAVVYPAKLDQTIACAASNCQNGTWSGSSSGPEVDISAPGESVWRAYANTASTDIVGRNHGTSFATAIVAGSAAVWLAFHGRDRLVARYGISSLSDMFKQLLRSDGFEKPPGWDTNNFGVGILNVRKLLEAPLPSLTPSPSIAAPSDDRESLRQRKFDDLMQLFPDTDASVVRANLASMLDPQTGDLNDADAMAKFDEVAEEIAYHALTDENFRDSLMTDSSETSVSVGPFGANEGIDFGSTTADLRFVQRVLPQRMSDHLRQLTSR